MNKKVCSKCKTELDLNDINFLKRGFQKNGAVKWDSHCRECRRKDHKIYRKIHPEKFCGTEAVRLKDRLTYSTYYREYFKLWRRNKYKTNLSFRIGTNLTSHLWHSLKGSSYECKSIKVYLGCTIEEFKEYIKLQFKDGMTWENYGPFWELDHIRPRASFDLSKVEEVRNCFHYSNYQPLLKKENTSKSSNFNGKKWFYGKVVK